MTKNVVLLISAVPFGVAVDLRKKSGEERKGRSRNGSGHTGD